MVAYVDGRVHTNVLETVWSFFKRDISGMYVSVEPFHLFRFLDEQAYRFNNRKLPDAERFSMAAPAWTSMSHASNNKQEKWIALLWSMNHTGDKRAKRDPLRYRI